MVNAKALEIRWHDQTPIFSADFHALIPDQHKKVLHPYAGTATVTKPGEEKIWRLATAGGDRLVRLWLVRPRPPPVVAPIVLVPSTSTSKLPAPAPAAVTEPSGPGVEYLATLKQHTGVVNVVRWCPAGEMLASAGDDGNVLFWVPGDSSTSKFGETDEDRSYERESWRVKSMLRPQSGQEIYDIAWSPDGTHILVGSVDHTANIFNVSNGQLLHTIAEHTNYVQGVAWDPRNHYIATQSSDRSMHIYSLAQQANGSFQVHAMGKNSRMEVQHQAGGSWRTQSLPSAFDEPSTTSTSKGKEPEPAQPRLPLHIPPLRRSVSQRSDSDRSEASSTPASASRFSLNNDTLPSPSTTITPLEEPTSMDPPQHPRPSSRRSSTSGSLSQVSHSPALVPTSGSFRHLRSPSPAPLPAVRVPLSPKLGATTSLPTTSGPTTTTGTGKTETLKLYCDANATPFFRRLSWSTDGSLLLTPAGLFEDPYASIEKFQAETSSGAAGLKKKIKEKGPGVVGKEKDKLEKEKDSTDSTSPKPTVYIYSRSNVSRPPIAHLPGHKTTSIAIRFCPILWELRKLRPPPPIPSSSSAVEDNEGDDCLQIQLNHEGVNVSLPGESTAMEEDREGEDGTKSLFDLPYRMVYAVATLDAVFLYDTQQAGPICMFGNLHYAPFTDLTWSADGQTLVVASQDGYCSVIAFDPLELGTPFKTSTPFPTPDHLAPPPPSTPTLANYFPLVPSAAPFLPPVPSTPLLPPPTTTTSASAIASVSASGSGTVVPEKRTAAEGEEEKEGDQPVKKKKKATLTHLGPLGT